MTIGNRIVHLDSVGSTMDEIASHAAAGAAEGLVVVAERQTAGRGRAGRPWHAAHGSSLLCSILLRPPVSPAKLSTLPLLAGVAVAEAIESVAPTRVQLKWPNDVWINGRKVAGILLQARSSSLRVDFVILGIGVNVNVAADDLPPGATSLLVATGAPADRNVLLEQLLIRLDSVYGRFVRDDGRADLDPWRDRAALLDERVVVRQDGGDLVGVLRGVDDDGALLLEEEGGRLLSIVAGELTRGPIARPDP